MIFTVLFRLNLAVKKDNLLSYIRRPLIVSFLILNGCYSIVCGTFPLKPMEVTNGISCTNKPYKSRGSIAFCKFMVKSSSEPISTTSVLIFSVKFSDRGFSQMYAGT